MTDQLNNNDKKNLLAPSWIESSLFDQLFKESFDNFHQIKSFAIESALANGENYSTLVLRIKLLLELSDNSFKKCSMIMKTAQDLIFLNEMVNNDRIFDVESGIYIDIIPEFEKLYSNVGLSIKFGPKSYKLPTKEKYILLEDLQIRGFRNFDRLKGFDMNHTKSALKLLAQWHAASAVYYVKKGPYKEKYIKGLLLTENLIKFKEMSKAINIHLLDCVRTCEGHENYYDDLIKMQSCFIEYFDVTFKYDDKFNVLNHGDYWCNNIMFRYDENGEIYETYMVDFQVPQYGSPLQDLYYMLFTSTNIDIKLNQFDYFIKYYHNELVKHLKLLKYTEYIPTVKDLHMQSIKYIIWGYFVATGMMAAALLDPCDNANLDNFMTDTNIATAFKRHLYTNKRYKKHIEMILPWLYNRGAF